MKRKKILLSHNDDENPQVKWAKKFISKLFWAILLVPVIKWFWPSLIPMGGFELWHATGALWDWRVAGKWLFAWAIGVSLVIYLISGTDGDNEPSEILSKGFAISLRAGVVEEIAFRWLIFMYSMAGLYIANWILGGFNEDYLGLVRWFNVKILGNIANFFTFGLMHDYIFHPKYWVIGASLITTNILFRDGHMYQKWFGWINSWYCGMFLFYIALTYGLLAAIILHFLYDMLLFTLAALFEYIEIKRGKSRRKNFWGR